MFDRNAKAIIIYYSLPPSTDSCPNSDIEHALREHSVICDEAMVSDPPRSAIVLATVKYKNTRDGVKYYTIAHVSPLGFPRDKAVRAATFSQPGFFRQIPS